MNVALLHDPQDFFLIDYEVVFVSQCIGNGLITFTLTRFPGNLCDEFFGFGTGLLKAIVRQAGITIK